ncbi:FtsX-like permease family protein [Sedimentitalea sp. JM2-8]|uniref:FtsX-like permease family protein n=1 Tax=Sedimentitalea xiamensis TaxID=3050037 RepID=A0ABT7FBV5_9RHOB|nr:FtsX-like permease family protein [Sedimentitalea xiamensis]MDK3072598.1 FtsX-like permease family protein [Sedimentitalea xiamensis]
MTRSTFLALLSHWRRQPMQLATLVLGLALATGLWSAVQAINTQARENYAEAAERLGINRFATLSSPSGPIAVDTYVRIRRAGWQVSPVLEGRIGLAGRSFTLLGVDVLTYPMEIAPQADEADVSPADVLTAPGRLFAHPDTIRNTEQAALPVPLVTSDRVPRGIVMTDIGTAERLLDRPGQISRMLVLASQPRDLPPLSDIVPTLKLTAPRAGDDLSRLTDSFHLNLTAFGLLSFAVGLFIVHGTAGLAFEQRRGMVRTLRALGVPLGLVMRLLMVELGILALVAGGLGLVLGYVVAAALLPDVAATLRGLYGAPVSGSLRLQPEWFASGIGMSLAGALAAGTHALWQVRRLPILTAPGQHSSGLASETAFRRQAQAGVAMMLFGLSCPWLLGGLVSGFVLLAGLMLGAALMLPLALSRVLSLIENRAQGALAEWFWADLRSQLPGLSLALMALLLALATNIGVGTMVSSFRLTFGGWLDQRLASELYITARSNEEGRRIESWLSDGQADAVLPIRHAETWIVNQPARIYGIVDHATYRDNWPLIASLPSVWDRVADGTGILINEQLARRGDLWPGDSVTPAAGWTMTIAGVYSDYGNPDGQAIVSLPLLLSRFDGVPARQFGVRISPDRAPMLKDALLRNFDLPASAIANQAEIKDRSIAVFEKTFVVTGALNVLTLGVASFAILTSLLTLWTMRLPQLAPLWALGLTRRKLARLELLRSVVLAGVTGLLALPLGLALAWVLLAVINVESFGWRLPMHLFPLDWLRLWLLALCAGAIAAALPARRLNRMPPSALLKVFADER